jgi:hypothetical protein
VRPAKQPGGEFVKSAANADMQRTVEGYLKVLPASKDQLAMVFASAQKVICIASENPRLKAK